MAKEERVIHEEDGKVTAKVPEDFKTDEELRLEEEGPDPEEEETEEDPEKEKEEEEPEEEEAKEEVAEEETEEEEVKEKYVGKSPEELVKMLEDRDVTIGKQGTKLQDYKDTDPKELSKEELKARLTSKDLREAILLNKKDIRVARQKLNDMDSEIDGPEKVSDAQKGLDNLLDAQDELDLDITQKISNETINKRFASQENTKFLKEKKTEFKNKLGIDGKEFDSIVEASKGYVGDDGVITLDTLGKGMIDLKGSEGVAKLHEINGNSKARKEIVTALKKGEKKISTTKKGGKRTRSVLVTDDMSEREVKRITENMSDEELFED